MENDEKFVLSENIMDLFLTVSKESKDKLGQSVYYTLLSSFPKHDVTSNNSIYVVSYDTLNLLSDFAKENGQVKIAKMLWHLPSVKKDNYDRSYY